jgi:hypothetical protein
MTTATLSQEPLTHQVEHNPQGHYQLHLSRLIARIIDNLYRTMQPEQMEALITSYPFIAAYQERFAGLPFESWLAEFEAAYPGHLPLRALQRSLSLSERDLDMLLAAGLIEEDIRLGALFAALQEPLPARHPCLGILSWLLGNGAEDARPVWHTAENLSRHGLLAIEREEKTVRLEWVVRIPMPIWDALRGEQIAHPNGRLRLQPGVEFPDFEQLILPKNLHERVGHLPEMVDGQQLDTLVLRGMKGAGRRTVLGAIAKVLGRNLLLHDEGKLDEEDARLLGPLATLMNALPVVRLQANSGETVQIERLPGYRGTLGIAMGRMGGIDGGAMKNALTLSLPPPSEAQRARFWQMADLPVSEENAAVIASRFLLTGGRIVRVGRLAHNHMTLAGRSEAVADDIREAMRAANRQALETLATPLTAVPGWSNLVVPQRVASELDVLEARCRGRERLLDHVGPAFKHNLTRGVRALFSGPSGTGKTLAARALAGALQMDVYRVDLAAVVNKYIGETEKNLNRIFTYAEELDIILLLDEGDSLMTQRTDVKGANDRYANLETNFLLQRLESYEGIILITTNASQRIDQAFIRRLDVVVDFVLPEAGERRLLWQIHLPSAHDIDEAFLERVVQRCKLSGGQIRNSALHASLLALHEQRPVAAEDLGAALQREYRKAGHPFPLAARNGRV